VSFFLLVIVVVAYSTCIVMDEFALDYKFEYLQGIIRSSPMVLIHSWALVNIKVTLPIDQPSNPPDCIGDER